MNWLEYKELFQHSNSEQGEENSSGAENYQKKKQNNNEQKENSSSANKSNILYPRLCLSAKPFNITGSWRNASQKFFFSILQNKIKERL